MGRGHNNALLFSSKSLIQRVQQIQAQVICQGIKLFFYNNMNRLHNLIYQVQNVKCKQCNKE